MALHVEFKVTDERAAKQGQVVSDVVDELQADPMSPGGLAMFKGGSVVRTIDAAQLKTCRAAEDPGSTGVSL